MAADQRRFVPFEGLWAMAIDVPYSFLVRDGDQAWTCGQLALDRHARVLAPNDLAWQSAIVCDHIEEVLRRGGLEPAAVKRLVPYYVHGSDAARTAMIGVLRRRFGPTVLLDPVPVPYFYYEGLVLEVDAFAGVPDVLPGIEHDPADPVRSAEDGDSLWLSLEAPADRLSTLGPALAATLVARGIGPEALLSGQWCAPRRSMAALAAADADWGLGLDPGTIIDSGPAVDRVSASLIFDRRSVVGVAHEVWTEADTRITIRRADDRCWVQARSHDASLGLIDQTRRIMAALDATLVRIGLDFSAVVKSTTHYTGDPSAETLHGNMAVRNRSYRKPGPASTGVPVFGFADTASRVVVALTLVASHGTWGGGVGCAVSR